MRKSKRGGESARGNAQSESERAQEKGMETSENKIEREGQSEIGGVRAIAKGEIEWRE